MKTRKLIFMISSVIVLTTIVFLFIYYKPHRSVKRADAVFTMPVTELVDAFVKDEGKANGLYLDKIIQVNGRLKEMVLNDSSLVLMLGDSLQETGISCYLSKDQRKLHQTLHKGDLVTVKGICNGMLFDVVLDKCIVITGK